MTDRFDDEDDAELRELDEAREALTQAVTTLVEERQIDDGVMALLLLEAAVSMSSLDYALSVAKPSESGLKLTLDRLQRGFGDLIRVAKKDAAGTVAGLRALLDEAEAAEDPDEE